MDPVDEVRMADAIAHGVYPPEGGKYRHPHTRTVEELTFDENGEILDHLWIIEPEEVHATARLLVDVGVLDTPQLVLDFYEKPWKWTPERVAAQREEQT